MAVLERFAGREPLTQSLAYLAAMQDRGWATVLVGGSVMILRPGFGRIQRPRAIDLPQLDLVVERTGLQRVVVEPALVCDVTGADGEIGDLAQHGFERAEPLAHTKTAVVDLADGLNGMLARCSASTRRNARLAAREADVVYRCVPGRELDDRELEELGALYRGFIGTRPWLDDDWDVKVAIAGRFPRRGAFVTARADGTLLGAVLVLVHDRVASYFAAFSTQEARALRVPTGLVIEAARFGLEQGCDLLDFVGIWDDRVPERYPRWQGFSTFKLRFGAEPVALPWAHELRI